jgi:hypothetical protein
MKVITQGYDPFSSVTHKNDQKISKDHYPATKKRVTLTYNGNIMGESWEMGNGISPTIILQRTGMADSKRPAPKSR